MGDRGEPERGHGDVNGGGAEQLGDGVSGVWGGRGARQLVWSDGRAGEALLGESQ